MAPLRTVRRDKTTTPLQDSTVQQMIEDLREGGLFVANSRTGLFSDQTHKDLLHAMPPSAAITTIPTSNQSAITLTIPVPSDKPPATGVDWGLLVGVFLGCLFGILLNKYSANRPKPKQEAQVTTAVEDLEARSFHPPPGPAATPGPGQHELHHLAVPSLGTAAIPAQDAARPPPAIASCTSADEAKPTQASQDPDQKASSSPPAVAADVVAQTTPEPETVQVDQFTTAWNTPAPTTSTSASPTPKSPHNPFSDAHKITSSADAIANMPTSMPYDGAPVACEGPSSGRRGSLDSVDAPDFPSSVPLLEKEQHGRTEDDEDEDEDARKSEWESVASDESAVLVSVEGLPGQPQLCAGL